MFKTLKTRIPAFNIGLALVSSLLMAFFCWQTARSALIDAATEKLQFAATARKTSIEQIFQHERSALTTLVANKDVANNLQDLSEQLDPANAARDDIIQAFTGGATVKERMAIDGRSQGGMYGTRQAKIHDAARKLVESGEAADVLLVDDKDLIVYTATKGSDFSKSLTADPLKSSGLAMLIARMKTEKGDVPVYQDFAAYPGDRLPSSFLAMPIVRKANAAMGTEQESVRIGYAVLRLNTLVLSVLGDREGLGTTGQVFAVGPTGNALSVLPLDVGIEAGMPITAHGISEASLVTGHPFSFLSKGDTDTIAATAPVSVMDATWTIIAEQSKAEALGSVSSLTHMLLLCLVVVMAVTVGAGLAMARRIVRPITAMADRMRALSSGDVASPIVGERRQDEIGHMAQAVAVFRDNALALVQSEREAEQARRMQTEERARIDEEQSAAAKRQSYVVESVASALDKLASGDLIHHLSTPFAPEYERLRADFNEAVGRLGRTMAEVLASTSAITAGTGEIAKASNDLSRRTEQQAASVEETATTLNELTSAVARSATASAHARAAVLSVRGDADQSTKILTRTAAAMKSIEQSSNQVAQITSLIDEIAFQTNLLALNAGVEAARAGETGRGFAVVASEVRALAQRSAEAATDIKRLISESSGQIKAGVELVDETSKAVSRIAHQIAEIDDIVQSIASTSHDQATGLSQINSAVGQMDQVIQQNAAMVEEASAATRVLTGHGKQLTALVGRFRVGIDANPSRGQAYGQDRIRDERVPARRQGGSVAALQTKLGSAVENWGA